MLAAQGLGRRRATAVTMRHLGQVLDRICHTQIDTVNVAVRAQYMPLFARLGPYDRGLLDRAAGRAPRRVFEYWIRNAVSFIDVDLYPAFRHRMDDDAATPWPRVSGALAQHPDLLDKIRLQVADEGPLTARQIEHPDSRERRPWWNWSDAKIGLEWLLDIGELTVAGRNSQFERLYDFPERVLPAEILARGALDAETATAELVRRSAAALGVATERHLAGYFRLDTTRAREAVQQLVAGGELVPVAVKGWTQPAYLWHEARLPRRVSVDALVSPFDSLVSDRQRLLETFGLDYRIEIYVPAPKRVWGYYVYLFVMDERIAARVDLKADRQAGRLLVQAAWLEPEAGEVETAVRLSRVLLSMAEWLGLGGVEVKEVGTLHVALASALDGARIGS